MVLEVSRYFSITSLPHQPQLRYLRLRKRRLTSRYISLFMLSAIKSGGNFAGIITVADSSSHQSRSNYLMDRIVSTLIRSHGSNRACSKGNRIGSSTNCKPSLLSAADFFFPARLKVLDRGRHRTLLDVVVCVKLNRRLILFLFLSRTRAATPQTQSQSESHSRNVLWHDPIHTRIYHLQTHHLLHDCLVLT